MKRTLLLTVCSVVLALGVHAQDDARSKAVLDKLITKAKAWTSFEADFSSRLQNTKDKLDVKQEGNMKVKGKKFRLVLDKNTIINDGTTLYTYNKDANEVNLSDPAEMDQELDPSTLFTQYEKGFKSTFVDEKADAAGVMVQTIKLFPLEPTKKAFHTVIIAVDKAKVEPKSIQVLYKDGNQVTYTLKKFTANPELADALFTFDKAKFPGVEVNDMR
ncbi:MAG: outer membrane lipoprotein carrier protein LolA [Flavobacteriales bacterium]|nr:outer membrane lipoprotein carrier protein LolA [Flavobacteriales bacterium]